MPRGSKPFYASKPSMKQSMTQSTSTSSWLARASQLGKNLSAVPAVPTLKGLLSNVEGGAKVVTPVVVQGPPVVSNNAPMVAFVPKELENSLLLNVVPNPLSVAVGKGNVKLLSSSDDDSSNSGSEESEESDSGSDGSDSSSTLLGMRVSVVPSVSYQP
jgi:hypothetical protein